VGGFGKKNRISKQFVLRKIQSENYKTWQKKNDKDEIAIILLKHVCTGL